jgi:hypothetical protein
LKIISVTQKGCVVGIFLCSAIRRNPNEFLQENSSPIPLSAVEPLQAAVLARVFLFYADTVLNILPSIISKIGMGFYKVLTRNLRSSQNGGLSFKPCPFCGARLILI